MEGPRAVQADDAKVNQSTEVHIEDQQEYEKIIEIENEEQEKPVVEVQEVIEVTNQQESQEVEQHQDKLEE